MSVGAVNKQTGDRIPTAGMPAVDSVLSGTSTNPVQNRVVKTALDEKADTDMVAADFNAGTSYTAGNYCVQDGKLYKFKNNHSGAWSATDVDEVKIAGELSSLKSGLIGRAALSAVTTNGDSFEVVNPNQNGNYYTYGLVVGGFSTRFAAYLIRCGVNTDEIAASPLSTDAGTMTFTRSGSTITIACSTTFFGGVRVIWLG